MEDFYVQNVTNHISILKHKRLSLESKILFLNVFFFLKLWYASHILPISRQGELRINKVVRSFLWNNEKTAPVRFTTLCKKVKEGGMGLINFVAHSRKIWFKLVKEVFTSMVVCPYTAFGINWQCSDGIKATRCSTNLEEGGMELHPKPSLGRHS